MPIHYSDPTGIISQFFDESEGGGRDRLYANLDSEEAKANLQQQAGVSRSMLDRIRTNIDFSERKQAYSIEEIVKGVTGGDQSQADAIISNFITTKGSPFNARSHFFNVLETWEASLPLNEMWLVFFTVPDIVTDELMGAWGEHIVALPTRQKNTPGKSVDWWAQMSGRTNTYNAAAASSEELDGGVNLARRRLLNPDTFTKVFGCAFAQTVTIPQEQLQTEQIGIANSRGFLRTPVVSHRQPFASLNIEFLETNISFVDFLLRPWTVLGGHLGSVARPEPLVTDVMLINFARAGFNPEFVDGGSSTTGSYVDTQVQNSRGFIPRKIWLFNGAQPITIDSQRHTYGASTSLERRTIEWMFRRYQVYLPNEFEGLFDDVHAADSGVQSPLSRKLHRAGQGMNAANDKRISDKINWAETFWGGKDGDTNPFDRSDIPMPKGDGGRRKFEQWRMSLSEAEADADSYWRGYDRQYSAVSRLGGDKWTIDGRGVDQAPEFTPVPGKGNPQEVGWDKEMDGESRLLKPERPHGHIERKPKTAAQISKEKSSGNYTAIQGEPDTSLGGWHPEAFFPDEDRYTTIQTSTPRTRGSIWSRILN